MQNVCLFIFPIFVIPVNYAAYACIPERTHTTNLVILPLNYPPSGLAVRQSVLGSFLSGVEFRILPFKILKWIFLNIIISFKLNLNRHLHSHRFFLISCLFGLGTDRMMEPGLPLQTSPGDLHTYSNHTDPQVSQQAGQVIIILIFLTWWMPGVGGLVYICWLLWRIWRSTLVLCVCVFLKLFAFWHIYVQSLTPHHTHLYIWSRSHIQWVTSPFSAHLTCTWCIQD